MGFILQRFEAFDLWKIEKADLEEFTKFVLRIYYKHHLRTLSPVEEVEACIKEDKNLYPHTHFYALKSKEGRIFGTVNACLWNGQDELPIEREYHLDLLQLLKSRGLNPPQIWHTGRFAIDRTFINQDLGLQKSHLFYFKLLLTCAFSHIWTSTKNLMVAECDQKLHRLLIKLGITSEELCKEHFVLGSDAVPILITGLGLQSFMEKHIHLLTHV